MKLSSLSFELQNTGKISFKNEVLLKAAFTTEIGTAKDPREEKSILKPFHYPFQNSKRGRTTQPLFQLINESVFWFITGMQLLQQEAFNIGYETADQIRRNTASWT